MKEISPDMRNLPVNMEFMEYLSCQKEPCTGTTTSNGKKLLSGFHTQAYEHLIFTTMNGHQSNGFYFIGKKQS